MPGIAPWNCSTHWRRGRRICGFGVKEQVLLCREWMVGVYDISRYGGKRDVLGVRKYSMSTRDHNPCTDSAQNTGK